MDGTEEANILGDGSNLDKLVEENFDVLNPGHAASKSQKRVNPEKQCMHCGWTAVGTRQIFVNHILGDSKGRRTIFCEDVPSDVKDMFRKAKLCKEVKVDAAQKQI